VAFTEKATAVAWETKPSWGSVAMKDQTINPDVERFGYQRAGVTTIEIESSHLVMLSRPKEVTDLIRTAISDSQVKRQKAGDVAFPGVGTPPVTGR
jgi:hypothetical protein